MCRVPRGECSPQRVATHPDRAATQHAHTLVAGMAAPDRVGTAEAATARHEDTAAAVTTRPRVAIVRPPVVTAHLAAIADRLMAVRQGDIVAEATPRRRRTVLARSAAAADTPGHMGAPEVTPARAAVRMAGAVRTVGVVRMVAEAATVAIANT